MNRRDMIHRLYAAVGRLLVQAMCVVDDVYRLWERLRRKRQEHPGPPNHTPPPTSTARY